MIVRLSDMAELQEARNFPALLAEYAEESAVDGMPPVSAKMATYDRLEITGLLHVYIALEEKELAGFLILLVPNMPHYGRDVATGDSIFVAKQYRHTLAGLKLMIAAEHIAVRLKSPGVFLSSPHGGKLMALLPKCGFKPVGHTFFKKVA